MFAFLKIKKYEMHLIKKKMTEVVTFQRKFGKKSENKKEIRRNERSFFCEKEIPFVAKIIKKGGD